jgi:hypothetical protein
MKFLDLSEMFGPGEETMIETLLNLKEVCFFLCFVHANLSFFQLLVRVIDLLKKILGCDIVFFLKKLYTIYFLFQLRYLDVSNNQSITDAVVLTVVEHCLEISGLFLEYCFDLTASLFEKLADKPIPNLKILAYSLNVADERILKYTRLIASRALNGRCNDIERETLFHNYLWA